MQQRDATGFYGQAASDDFSAPIDTHWSRILHYDLLATPTVDGTSDPADIDKDDRMSSDSDSTSHSSFVDDKETYVAVVGSVRDIRSHRRGSANRTATTRLAVFIAIYTAIAGIVHFLFWPEAVAVVPEKFEASAPVAASYKHSPIAEDGFPSEAQCATVHSSKDRYEQIIDAD